MYTLEGSPLHIPFPANRGVTAQRGRTYYVDQSGSDSHEGTDPEYPLATIAAAYTKTAKKGDYIIVYPYWAVGSPPLVINGACVHIVAMGAGGFDSGSSLYSAASVSVELATGCQDLELAGFNLGGTGESECIDVTGQVSRVHIHHCTFGWNIKATDGIAYTYGGALLYPTIENNYFGHQISAVGISAYLNSGMIAHNVFHINGTNGIYCTAGGFNIIIFSNIFYSPDDDGESAGWAIRLSADTSDCMVTNNQAMSRGSAPSLDPYRDQTGAANDMLNGWGANYDGDALAQPGG